MIRTCAPISIEDCKIANGVTYCYCKHELCNSPDRKLSDPGSGIASSSHVAREIHLNTQLTIKTATADDEDLYADEEYSDIGSGNEPYYPDDDNVFDPEDYPDTSDQTEPPPFIVDESDLYRKPTADPDPPKQDDFGFVDDIRDIKKPSQKNTFEPQRVNGVPDTISVSFGLLLFSLFLMRFQ
jgi:hypothetical protein